MRIKTFIPTTGLPVDYKQVLLSMGCETGVITTEPPADYPVKYIKEQHGFNVAVDGFLSCSDEERKTFYETAPKGVVYHRTPCTFVQITLPDNWSSMWDVISIERGRSVSWEEPSQLVHTLHDDNKITRLRCDYDLKTDQSIEAVGQEYGGRKHPYYAIPSASPRFTFYIYAPESVRIWDHATVTRSYETATIFASLHTYNARLSNEQKDQLRGPYKAAATEIIRQSLPDMDDALAYWGQDNSRALAEITQKFSAIEQKYYKDYAESKDAQPRFDFANYDYALFFDDAEWRISGSKPRVDAPRGFWNSQNPEFFQRMERNCRAIVKKFLPDADNPSAYWGKNCNQEIQTIRLHLDKYDRVICTNHNMAEKGEIASFTPRRSRAPRRPQMVP